MALTQEWVRRIEHWRQTLWELCYRPLGDIAMEGFTTTAHLTATEAAQQPFTPMPPGTRWGAKWEYGWFRGACTLPQAADGERIVLRLKVGEESLVWVNDQIVSTQDWAHFEIPLATNGAAGTHYQILTESYGGHGLRDGGGGPAVFGVPTIPEPEATQQVIGVTTFGIWDEAVYQLALDLETLMRLRNSLEGWSLRVATIDQALQQLTLVVDLELPHDQMIATIQAGRALLQPLLQRHNGPTTPTMYAVGHGHLDVAWLWPLQETERKIARTVANQLALMDEYPDYTYIQSQPHLLLMLKTHYPELYDRVRAYVEKGQFVVEGGMWVEPDTNLPSGESLIRQFLHGKRFLREEFGKDSQLLWLPDVFGYSAALPQIMRGCGVPYFCTQKIRWLYNGGVPFPLESFTWEGIDGSEVLAHIFYDYNHETQPDVLINVWKNRAQQNDVDAIIVPFGYGDGGGGPTRNHLEYLRREVDLEGVPHARQASPLAFFHHVEALGLRERYVGELYFQNHRGTYTSQAKTKRGNRQSEVALREAEFWSTIAHAVQQFPVPVSELRAAWQTVLLNQFHDIVPGSSIHRVYEEAEASYAAVQRVAAAVAQSAATALAPVIDAATAATLTVFNSLSWPRTVLVPLPEHWLTATKADGAAVPTQQHDGQTLALVQVPPCGWTTVSQGQDQPTTDPAAESTAVIATPALLENAWLRVEFDATGEIQRIFDKQQRRELAAGVCNHFALYKDVPGLFDAWDIDSNYRDQPIDLSAAATIEVVSAGPLVGSIRVRRQLHDSLLTQEIRLRADSQRVDFVTTIDWHERHKLLKVLFPVTIHANEAIHEIQFGHIRRPNHASRPVDATQFEVVNHKWSALVEGARGAAIVNDCKYGINVVGNTFGLTLLKSALAPDMTADQGLQQFTYSFYAWEGSLAASDIIHEAYDLNYPPLLTTGTAGEGGSVFTVDAPNVIIDTVKPAEDGSSDVIVRLYEAMQTATRCTLTVALPITTATQTTMLEAPEQELVVQQGEIVLDFRPFEIKTLRLA